MLCSNGETRRSAQEGEGVFGDAREAHQEHDGGDDELGEALWRPESDGERRRQRMGKSCGEGDADDLDAIPCAGRRRRAPRAFWSARWSMRRTAAMAMLDSPTAATAVLALGKKERGRRAREIWGRARVRGRAGVLILARWRCSG